MKNQIKTFILLLALLLPVSALAYDFMVDGIAYNINGNEASVTYTDSTNQFSHNYSGLTIAMIPSSVTYGGTNYSVTAISESAFSNCGTMTSVTIPNTIKSSAVGAFRYCNALTRVNISDFQAWCKISFKSGNSNPLCYAHYLYLNGNKITDLVIPESLTSINSCVFWGCSAKSVTIPSSINSIGWCAFMDCRDMEKVIISSIEAWCKIQFVSGGSNPLSSAHHLYLNESEITDLVIPNSITSIGYGAFWSCSGLKSVTISKSVVSISSKAFYGCSGLSKVICLPINPPSAYSETFPSGVYSQAELSVPDISIDQYKTAVCWKEFSNITGAPILVSELYLGSYYDEMYINDTLRITATVLPEYASNKSLNWTSSNPNVAIVNSEGVVIGKSAGTATITATTKDGSNLSASCTINVKKRFATSISVNKSSTTIIVGETEQLTATVYPANASDKTVTWTSSDPSVATVSSSGLVTAVSVGNATITARTADGSNLNASCVVTVTEDLSNYDNYLSINDIETFPSETIVIPIAMTNTDAIFSFQTDIFLPDELELVQEDGEYLIEPSDRMTRTHSIVSDDVSNGAIRVLCYSSNYKPFTGNSGDDLFYITVKVSDDAVGDCIILLRNTLLTNSDFEEIAAPDVLANVKIKDYLLGDANHSGTVTVTDVVVTSQYVLEQNPQPFVFRAADVNADGNITVTDVSRIAWMVLNPTHNAPRQAPVLWNNGDRMSAEGITLTCGETRRVSIVLDNEMDYSAFQLDLKLPDGLTASNFQLTDRASGHAFDVNTLQSGSIRALCYSPALTSINGHDGALLTFDVTATSNVNGDILVDGIELATTTCQTVKLDAFTIAVNAPSSVNEIANGKTIARVDYFNLAGQQLSEPKTGVNLVVTTYTDGTRSTTKLILQ